MVPNDKQWAACPDHLDASAVKPELANEQRVYFVPSRVVLRVLPRMRPPRVELFSLVLDDERVLVVPLSLDEAQGIDVAGRVHRSVASALRRCFVPKDVSAWRHLEDEVGDDLGRASEVHR